MLVSWLESPESMQGCSGGVYKATEAYVRGEYGEYGWVPCVGVAQLSHPGWFFHWRDP